MDLWTYVAPQRIALACAAHVAAVVLERKHKRAEAQVMETLGESQSGFPLSAWQGDATPIHSLLSRPPCWTGWLS